MRGRQLSASAGFGLAILILTVFFAAQQFSLFGQPTERTSDRSPSLQVSAANAYTPESKAPRGIRITARIDTSELRVDEAGQSEFDVALSKALSENFEVLDATIWTDEKDQKLLNPSLQPFQSQSPPKGVQARLLLPALKQGKYNLDLYLGPKNEKIDPDVGLAYLGNADDRRRNVQVTLVNSAPK